MKKILMAIVTVLFAAPSFAQYSSGGFSLSESTLYYGLRMGPTFSTLTGDYVDLGTKVGINLGAVVGARVSESTPIFLESGLYYSMRGSKKGKTSVGLNYLEIPILIKYGVQVADEIAILPYVGPYFAYGISGKYKIENGNVVQKRGSYNYFNHWDMGFKIGCGAEYNKLYAELGYQIGVSNLAKDTPEDLKAHTSNIYFNVGVNF
ncbi:MAG: PorT family protein [Prevotella sp.]|nr:PorT family protein [Prevotella sp.]